MHRTVLSVLVTAVMALGLGLVAIAPAEARLPSRTITENNPGQHQVSYNAFKLKGQVLEPQADGGYVPYVGKVHLQKKACGKCAWKTVKKLKSNQYGRYKTRILAPEKGRWKWRVKVKASSGFGTTKGKTWTLFFK